MDSYPLTPTFVVSVFGLFACLAIYTGAKGRGWVHKLAVSSGVAVVLCIAFLHYAFRLAEESFVNGAHERVLTIYLFVCVASATALSASCLLLLWSNRQPRPNSSLKRTNQSLRD